MTFASPENINFGTDIPKTNNPLTIRINSFWDLEGNVKCGLQIKIYRWTAIAKYKQPDIITRTSPMNILNLQKTNPSVVALKVCNSVWNSTKPLKRRVTKSLRAKNGINNLPEENTFFMSFVYTKSTAVFPRNPIKMYRIKITALGIIWEKCSWFKWSTVKFFILVSSLGKVIYWKIKGLGPFYQSKQGSFFVCSSKKMNALRMSLELPE